MVTTTPSEFAPDVEIRSRAHAIGCIGAGMIMADNHLAAYAEAGFPVVAIASRTPATAQQVADRWGIGTVHSTPSELLDDERVEIVDIAFPPDQQPAIIREALTKPHIRAILAQKPLALDLDEAVALRDEAAAAGKILSVNQNMRYDQSIRVLKQILDRGELGDVVFASIDMRAIPHWQTFLEGYDRLTLANMSVHHLDALRYLFGDPTEISTVVREDPRTAFEHEDGIVVSTLRFPGNVLALSLEDVWSGPREEGFDSDLSITWRVEGTRGVAKGTIGWPTGQPSTLTYASAITTDGRWVTPTWDTHWFPHAFIGVMEQVQNAVETDTEPELSVADNVKTMALIEAGYRSIAEKRPVQLLEFTL
ncbi:oxidoreductase [Cnuibacter physcomitrellae]|uniref:Oxidoreductase n=1 Tax=Cnuibacter physcomitrellae TaxID=1619308 RepID=A0A1X9LW45_9MICO|nr:Gfo/Idh/MocA family oxidoreductase [Cnuibacter physcomitrellae]ARJ06260.1 oxidoreductase [Cnuibacter physcomitrellae]GGI37594.1 oxidoreductase [Cnuibacter physcomitrellae]